MSELSWHPELDAEQRSAVHQLLEEATRTDGVAPVSEHVVLGLRAPAATGRDPHLLATNDGAVTGYASLTESPPMAELVVHPQHRRDGTGTELAEEVLATGGDELRIWAHGNSAAAQGLAERLGLVSRRELWQMRLDLDAAELPPAEPPAGTRLRTYVPHADDAAVLAVNNAAFAWHPEQGGWGEQELAERRAEPWFDAAGFFLAETDTDGGELLGFHWTKVHPPEAGQPAVGEVYVVAIAPNAQGRGLGRVLTLAGLHHLKGRGLHSVLLYVEGDNTAAVHTYSRLGFRQFHLDVAYGTCSPSVHPR